MESDRADIVRADQAQARANCSSSIAVGGAADPGLGARQQPFDIGAMLPQDQQEEGEIEQGEIEQAERRRRHRAISAAVRPATDE